MNLNAFKYPATVINRRWWLVLGIVMLGGVATWRGIQLLEPQDAPTEIAVLPEITTVTALGHLEPAGEIIQLTAPTSAQESRIQALLVAEGYQAANIHHRPATAARSPSGPWSD